MNPVSRTWRSLQAKLHKGTRANEREHIDYLERRLHVAEFSLLQLDAHGVRLPLADDDLASYAPWLAWSPPGHFYSPVPNRRELDARSEKLWPDVRPDEIPGIDLRAKSQLDLFSTVAGLARTLDAPKDSTSSWRYFSDNVSYGIGDGLTLHGMLRHIKPRRLIEVGSGYSSAMILDTVERFLDGQTELTFIEPYPQLLETLLRPADHERVVVVPESVQDVPLETFSALTSGDVLFIDSTHVLKTGSDVNWLYSQVLPVLNAGVYVHIHDIFYPFEYPKPWVLEGRAWGEAYIVRAFLTLNTDFEIELFNDWLIYFHSDLVARELPAMLTNAGGALWLRRVRKSR